MLKQPIYWRETRLLYIPITIESYLSRPLLTFASKIGKDEPACHSERSEESQRPKIRILRFAQNDMAYGGW